jgi:Carboxypeptidase regulatory-like domain
VVDLEVEGGVLVARRSNVYPPGTLVLSGQVTEVTATGPVGLEGAQVSFTLLTWTGYRTATTDRDGFYSLQGLYPGRAKVFVANSGFASAETALTMTADQRFDITLVRR